MSEPLRALLDRHMSDWRIVDEREKMEIHGWLKATGVQIRVAGLRESVVETVQALIATLVATQRVDS